MPTEMCTSIMLRNHLIISVQVEPFFQKIIGLYYALLLTTESLIYLLLLSIHFKIRKGRHPFFGLLFGLVLVCYITSAMCDVFGELFYIFGADGNASNVVYSIYDLSYSVTTALCFCCLIERTLATVWAVSYETYRNWKLFVISVLIEVFAYVHFGSFRCRSCILPELITVVIISGCIGLYFLNKKWTIRYQSDLGFMSKVTLSMRYQIIENMIVVRKALLPFLIIDSLITIVDYSSFEVNSLVVDNLPCHSLTNFIPYIICNHVAMILEYTIPLYLLMRKEYRKELPSFIARLFVSPRVNHSHDSIIQNVFGRELNVAPTQNEYFANLRNEWN